MENESHIEALKEKYATFQEKYSLPSFTELNKIFDIEEIEIDTEFFLRKIRKIMTDKISHYVRFIEGILNPSNSLLFFYKMVKKLDQADKSYLIDVQEILGNQEIKIVSLELDYNEEKEAACIKEIYEIYHAEIKEKLKIIIEKMCNGEEHVKKIMTESYVG
jgi:hypothetical protein